ncbi:MAG: Lrp/AsnC family transcriptional regulator [Desulfotalea sp.]
MIDQKSMKILKILQEKARIPNAEVSRQVGLAPSAVLERIRKMESQGIIDGYEVRLNPERFNRKQVAFVEVTAQPDAYIPDLGEKLAALPEVLEVHYVSNGDGFLLKIRTADTASLGTLLQQTISTMKEVQATRTTTVLSTTKETNRITIE